MHFEYRARFKLFQSAGGLLFRNQTGSLLTVLSRVMFCRLLRMVSGMEVVTMGNVRVMTALLMGARVVVFRGLAMMPRRVLVVFRRFFVVLCTFMVGHGSSPFCYS